MSLAESKRLRDLEEKVAVLVEVVTKLADTAAKQDLNDHLRACKGKFTKCQK